MAQNVSFPNSRGFFFSFSYHASPYVRAVQNISLCRGRPIQLLSTLCARMLTRPSYFPSALSLCKRTPEQYNSRQIKIRTRHAGPLQRHGKLQLLGGVYREITATATRMTYNAGPWRTNLNNYQGPAGLE